MKPTAFFVPVVLFVLPVLSFAQAPAATPAEIHGIVLADIDHSVKPGDDFYLYANGKWQARTEIPADRSSLSSFSLLNDKATANVAAIIADAAKSSAPRNTDQRRIADLYRSYMDTATLDTRGLASLKPQLAEIDAIHTSHDLSHALGLTLRVDVDALNNTNFHTANLFGLWVAPGFNDPEHYTPYLMQGGLALPSRDFYLGDSERFKGIRAKYLDYATAMFRLVGLTDPDKRAIRVLQVESQIARKHLSLAENEDIHKANNTWTVADFQYKAPGIEWKEFFAAAGLAGQKSFIVWQPSAFAGEAALVASLDIEAWKDVLRLHLLNAYAVGLSKPYSDQSFAFFGTVLTGAPQQRPREQRATLMVNAQLGDAVGKLYAQRFFSPEEKAQVQALVANLLVAFHKRLENLTWMAPATKAEAIAKLETLKVGVGYPDKWRSYDGLEIKPDDLLGNMWRSKLFEYHYQLSRIGKPVDRAEWTMTPQTVNAVNLPLDNGLNFPAAILQPPFFDPKAPAAFNYGAIGSVIGHEISHTFDSEGAAFDSKGRVRNWWTAEDLAHFDASTATLAAQYDAYHPFADLALNGRQTLGENIADVAGLVAAYDAFRASLNGKPAPVVDGLTGDQQFFLAYAQNRTQKTREASLRQQVLTDPHSPGEYRADTVRNLDAWYGAFGVKEDEKLSLTPNDRVRIW